MNWIKNGFLTILGLTLCLPAVAEPLMKNPNSLQYLDIELPFRCSSAEVDEGEGIVSSVALSNTDFTVRLPGQTALLPRYQVNGFSFSNKTADTAIAELLKEAEIKVVAEEGQYQTLSARDLKGELSSVLEKLTGQAGLFYTYQPNTKTLLLTHKTKAVLQVPHNRLVMMAVLDALNGAHLDPISVDWKNFKISLRLTRYELDSVQTLMVNLVKEKYILAAQVKIYDVNTAGAHWQQVVDKLGTRGISTYQNGLVGQAFVLNQQVNEDDFLKVMSSSFRSTFVGSGRVVVPSGWRTRFNFNQCAPIMSYSDLSLFLQTSIKKKNEAQTILTLDSSAGEVASFDMINNLDQKVMIVGIPVPDQPKKELMLSLQFQFIQLIKKGEQND